MRRPRSTRSRFEVAELEGRVLLSHMPITALAHPTAELAHRHHGDFIKTNPAGVAAILAALNGGAGHEFVTLIHKEVHNLGGVIMGFETGRITQYTIPGFAAKIPNLQPDYTGPAFDRMALTESGAVLLKGGIFELASISRGAFFASDVTSTVVFGLNRGMGASLGPAFSQRPGITPDMEVTVTVTPNAQSYSGTITDLVTGATSSLSASQIQVDGPVVRVFLNLSQVPSEGFAIPHYQFGAWTSLVPSTGISSVGSFTPEDTMIPIGVLASIKAPHGAPHRAPHRAPHGRHH